MTRTPSVGTTAEPAPGEIDRMLGELEASWKATITIRRQAPNDVGYREIFVSLDDERLELLLMHGDLRARRLTTSISCNQRSPLPSRVRRGQLFGMRSSSRTFTSAGDRRPQTADLNRHHRSQLPRAHSRIRAFDQ